MKSESWLIVQVGMVLAILTGLCFFVQPVYEKGAWAGLVVFSSAFSGLLGYKFGRSMPQQSTDAKPGQTSEVQTKIATTPEPPALPAQ